MMIAKSDNLAVITTWFIFALVLLQDSNTVDGLSCVNDVSGTCACDWDHVTNGQRDDAWCNRLQVCANCLTAHGCNSESIRQFASLLLSTMTAVDEEKVCPRVDYEPLVQRLKDFKEVTPAKPANDDKQVSADQGHCHGNGYVYNECGQRCNCSNGRIATCVRIRKEFTQMTFEERRRFVDVYYTATTDPMYKDEFNGFLDSHGKIPSDFLHMLPNIFLPWHRWYLLKEENFLRKIDCRITLPYYDYTARVSDGAVFRASQPTDLWNSGPHGIGGNGVAPSLCVQDGRFREGNWFMPDKEGGGCLQRDLYYDCKLYDDKDVNALMKRPFKVFEQQVRINIHGHYHLCLGGNMDYIHRSANAPEFTLHHSFVDKLWSTFQKTGAQKKYAYFTSINKKMPLADMYPWELLDNGDLPGRVAVEYE